MNAIFFVLKTGGQWNTPNATEIRSSGSVHRRFRNSAIQVFFERFWQNGLLVCEHLNVIDWS